MTNVAPAPVHFARVFAGSVTSTGPLKLTLTGAHRAVVTAERRHPNDRPPLLHLDDRSYLINDVVLFRGEDGTWRASVDCASRITRVDSEDGMVAADPVTRREILKALEVFVTREATMARLWVAGRNALYRAQNEQYFRLQGAPDDSEVRAEYNRIGAEIARWLELSIREV